MRIVELDERNAVDYFKDQVSSALANQHVQSSDLTEYYLVNLLYRFLQPDRDPDYGEPLAVRLARALGMAGTAQRERLRQLGDVSLFTAGFFSDSFNRRNVDVDYYVSMGEYAYGSLSHTGDAFRGVFQELSRNFVGFTDVLSDISERHRLTSNSDLLRLYERWLRTGSSRDEKRLIELGITPNRSVGKRFLQ